MGESGNDIEVVYTDIDRKISFPFTLSQAYQIVFTSDNVAIRSQGKKVVLYKRKHGKANEDEIRSRQ